MNLWTKLWVDRWTTSRSGDNPPTSVDVHVDSRKIAKLPRIAYCARGFGPVEIAHRKAVVHKSEATPGAEGLGNRTFVRGLKGRETGCSS
jgi:hypothetical protein